MKLFSDLACFELEVHSFVEQTGLSASANPENGHGASQNHPFGRVWKIGQPTSVRQRLSSSVSVGPTRKYSRSGPSTARACSVSSVATPPYARSMTASD